CDATVLVTDRSSLDALSAHAAVAQVKHILVPSAAGRGAAAAVVEIDAALAGITRWHDPEPTRADDPAYLVYTSGTTGYPKGVLHAHRALLGRQPSSQYWFDFLARGERVLHSGKLNWTYVLGTGMMDPLYRGHTAVLHEGTSDAALWPRLIARHRAT